MKRAALVLLALAVAGCAAAGPTVAPHPTTSTSPTATTAVSTASAPPPASPTVTTPPAQSPSPATSPTATSVGPSPFELLWLATPPGEQLCPWDMALDPNGRLWVAATCSSRFAIFNPDGTFVEYWEHRGSGIGEFNLQRPSNQDGRGEIAFAPDGSFYVLDVGNRRVEHFDRQRMFIKAWGGFGDTQGTYRDLTGLGVSAEGVVYILDDVRNVVETYDSDGTFLGSFDAQMPNASPSEGDFFTLDPAGNAYISDCCSAGNSRVQRFDANGALIATLEAPGAGPIAVDAAGRMFVASGQNIAVLNPDGTVISTFNVPGLDPGGIIFGIFLDGYGNCYVAQDGIQKFRLLPPFAPAVTPSPSS